MIDIILPLYKANDKVFDAIDSVLNQTYKNWHIYIIDDASKDDSVEKLKTKYKDFSEKITYIQFQDNRRAAACRNYAIKRGSGQVITFIDQDDVWIEYKLELQVKYIKNHNVDVVHGNVQFIDNENNVIMNEEWEAENRFRREIDWTNLSCEELARKILINPNIRIISSMIKREAFEKIGGFKEQFFGGEDETFWFELALNGRIGFIDNILFKRRMHDRNTLDVYKLQRLKGYEKALKYLSANYRNVIDDIFKDQHARILYNLASLSFKRKKYFTSVNTLFKLIYKNPMYLYYKMRNKIK